MPTLSASSSLFQLAVGVNAVIPALISDFEIVRNQAADSLLRNIGEYNPAFTLKERDRHAFISFCLKASGGLRLAKVLTHITVSLALSLCALSLGALCWSATQPNREISVQYFFWFVAVTLVIAPSFYVARNLILKQIYRTMADNSLNDEREVLQFTDSFKNCLEMKKLTDAGHELIHHAQTTIYRTQLSEFWRNLKYRWYSLWTRIQLFWIRLRSRFQHTDAGPKAGGL
jgi:hypothetical protein